MASSLDWLLTALQGDDVDVAALALLRLWQRVQRAAQSASLAALALEASALPKRAWRRLGLLLFASDPVSVRAVVSIALAVAVPEGQPMQRRIWQSDWRQFIVDKLIDCNTRAATTKGDANVEYRDGDVALRLIIALGSVFVEALQSGSAIAKDQARTVDVFVDLALSPVDAVACVALQMLHKLIQASSDVPLDSTVQSYLEASNLFPDLVAWIHTSLSSAALTLRANTQSKQGRRYDRHCLVIDLLITAASQNADVSQRIAQRQSDALLHLVLHVAESEYEQRNPSEDHQKLQARTLELLAVVLRYDTVLLRELASAVRLGGALITVSWLLGHTSPSVRKAAHEVINHIIGLSSPRDVTRALMEQGCVLICYTFLADENIDGGNADGAAPCRVLLAWIVRQLESQQDQQIALSMAISLRRSTNAKLQRNVVLSLLLLSHSSSAVHGALFCGSDHPRFLHEIMRDLVRSTDDGGTSLATALISAALLLSDKSSTLKLEATVPSIRSLSLHNALDQSAEAAVCGPTDGAIVCASGERVVVDPVLIMGHCKVFARELQRLRASTTSPPSLALVTFDLSDHEAETVRWLVRTLPMAPPHAARELQQLDDPRLVARLLRLAKIVDCTKCWHAASLAITHTLDATNWRAALDLALDLRHPALLLRALRAVLAALAFGTLSIHTNPPSEVSTHSQDLKDASLLAWRELLALIH